MGHLQVIDPCLLLITCLQHARLRRTNTFVHQCKTEPTVASSLWLFAPGVCPWSVGPVDHALHQAVGAASGVNQVAGID